MPRPPVAAATNAPAVRITSQGTVTIPKQILRTLDIGPGTMMAPEVRGRTVVLTPKTLVYWDADGVAAAQRARAGAGRSPAFKTIAAGKRWLDSKRRTTKGKRK
jgi:AbrB family looped-hinge helix DNA binding protein